MLYTPGWSSFIPKYPCCSTNKPKLVQELASADPAFCLAYLVGKLGETGWRLGARVWSPKNLKVDFVQFWYTEKLICKVKVNGSMHMKFWSLSISFCWLGFKKIVHVRGFATITNTFRNQLRPTVCFLLTTWLRMATRREKSRNTHTSAWKSFNAMLPLGVAANLEHVSVFKSLGERLWFLLLVLCNGPLKNIEQMCTVITQLTSIIFFVDDCCSRIQKCL